MLQRRRAGMLDIRRSHWGLSTPDRAPGRIRFSYWYHDASSRSTWGIATRRREKKNAPQRLENVGILIPLLRTMQGWRYPPYTAAGNMVTNRPTSGVVARALGLCGVSREIDEWTNLFFLKRITVHPGSARDWSETQTFMDPGIMLGGFGENTDVHHIRCSLC